MSTTATALTVENGIARLRFTDPEHGNPINRRLCDEMCDRAIELSCRSDVRVVLVTAEGKNFGFGGDIAHFVAQGDQLPSEIKRMTATIHSAIARLQRMDAPMVAAVQGVCAGGSAAFAAGCDVVVSADNARWVAAYTGIGYSTDASATVMFSRRMGLARARNFLLRNQVLDAQAALAAGLVDEVVPTDELLTQAEAIALKFAAGPTKAYGEVRRLLLSVQDQPLETQLEMEAQALSRVASTEDAREGLAAFNEKRKPRFTGR
ncbi:enoyl-CoA hydratase-related protein [Nevskia sp.]|uniref:enoyl-CoA hydratase/isomerase family protein n=1 Tax=Nevskia sp. TaxID=1929292 RepID=UPI0025D806AD|nr:enoyl-CoA hydratase-related protein [Nevskia sp.]